MGTKTSVNNKGVVTAKTAGSEDEFLVDAKRREGITNYAPGESGPVGVTPVTVYEGSVAGVTASLPAIGAGNVGLEYKVINADVTADIMISGTNGNVIDSDTEEFTLAEEGATMLAISSSLDGYSWIALTNKA